MKEIIKEGKVILKHKNLKKIEKEANNIKEKVQIVAEISKYGGPGQNCKHVGDELTRLVKENTKQEVLEWL